MVAVVWRDLLCCNMVKEVVQTSIISSATILNIFLAAIHWNANHQIVCSEARHGWDRNEIEIDSLAHLFSSLIDKLTFH